MSFWDEDIQTIYRDRDREEMRWKAALEASPHLWQGWLYLQRRYGELGAGLGLRREFACDVSFDGRVVCRRCVAGRITLMGSTLFHYVLSIAQLSDRCEFYITWDDKEAAALLPQLAWQGLLPSLRDDLFAEEVAALREFWGEVREWVTAVGARGIHVNRLHWWLTKHKVRIEQEMQLYGRA